MSRIGKKPIAVPKGVKVEIKGRHVKVTGPKGTLEKDIRPEVELVTAAEGELVVNCRDNSKQTAAFSGLTRSLVRNMITGVNAGFNKKLIVEGVGYKADVANKVLTLSVGYSNPVKFHLPDNVKASVEKETITLESLDKELLGLTEYARRWHRSL